MIDAFPARVAQSATRSVTRIVAAEDAMEGAGVQIRRIMPLHGFTDVDPFVLLDEIRSSDPGAYIAGFPPHPHRGIETVTYMLAGRMRHKDSNGNEGVIGAGDVQWMTAGRGIIHSEMPEQHDGLMWGFQLWINLPRAEKMTTPSSYRELPADAIPTALADGVTVRVISGSFGDLNGPAPGRTTDPLYLDIAVPASHEIAIPIGDGRAAFAYVYDGEMGIGPGEPTLVPEGHAAVTALDGALRLTSRTGGRLLLFAGRPNGEPIVRHGPFVMTNEADLRRAIVDVQSGTFLSPQDT